MKFYILCDIEGVASLTCWDEARSANACYAPMAREMALEAAAAARGLFSGGADEVVIEDMHGDGCNIDCALLPRDARLLRGITHDIVGLTGIFDESYDGMLMVGFHDARPADRTNQIRPRLRRSDKDPGACLRGDRGHDGRGCGGGKNSRTSGTSRSLPRGGHLCTPL